MRLSVLDYTDDLDVDFREQIRASGKNLHVRLNEVIHQITKKEKGFIN